MADVGEVRSVAMLAKQALLQTNTTPEEEQANLRALISRAIPLLEEFALVTEREIRERNEGWRRQQYLAKQAAKRKYGWA